MFTRAFASVWLVTAYIGNIRNFSRHDWLLYLSWISTLGFLFVGMTTFLLIGHFNGVDFPDYVWLISIGSGMFALALAVDDIGHRTLYKEYLETGEGYVHKMIVVTAVGSVVALSLCFEHAELMHVPAYSLIWLSLFYSAIDEALHWYRYLTQKLDKVEMWSHFFAILGHVIMIAAWWHWYSEGYLGVRETLSIMGVPVPVVP